jgi:hypothetical protein
MMQLALTVLALFFWLPAFDYCVEWWLKSFKESSTRFQAK